MQIDPQEYERIAQMIVSADSPVGINAKQTHIYIIHLLHRLERKLDEIGSTMARIEN